MFFRRAGWRARWHEGDKGGQGGHKGGIRRARGHPVNRKGGREDREREGERERKREKENGSRRVTQHNKSRCWWRTAGQMHFTTRSAPTVQSTVGSLPGHPRSPSPSSPTPFVDSRLATCSWTRAGRPARPANWFQLFPDHVTCRGFYMDNWLLLLFRYPARDSAGFIAEDRRLSPDAPLRRGRDFRHRASSNSGSPASDSFRPRAVRQLLLRHPSCISRRMTWSEINSYKLAWIDKEVSTWPFPLSDRFVKSVFVPVSAAPSDYRRNPLFALDFSAIWSLKYHIRNAQRPMLTSRLWRWI